MAQLLTLPKINSLLANFEKTYADLCHRIELPHKTYENRTSYALHMGLPNDRANRASLILGGVHAREWGGPDIVVAFAGDLLRAYTDGKGLQYNQQTFSAEDIKRIFEESTIVIFPCVNPDGFEYSRTKSTFWRKNRNPDSSGGDPKKVGVDINRNYDFLWDYKKHFHKTAWVSSLASDDESVETFHGTEPFSEPETRNVKWLMDAYPGLRWFMDVHSFAGDVLFSWGDDSNQSQQVSMSFTNPAYDGLRGHTRPFLPGNQPVPDGLIWSEHPDEYGEYVTRGDGAILRGSAEIIRDAMNAVWGRPYIAKQSIGLYPTSGASDDYAFSRHVTGDAEKTYAFTIEFNFGDPHNRDNFIATRDPDVLDKTLKEVVPGLIAFARLATKPPTVTHTPVAPHGDISYVNVFTGDSWSIGPGGIIHHPSVPDPYVTDLGREIGRLLGAHETLSRTPGKAGEVARAAILEGIAKLAQGKNS
ncbi:MAG: M14 family zinc carboxypeptidase [Pseudorhodoplanes sp.]|uniref:M14 family zinc carboxypeptidase n=1 Tax=Pseudorhodoplanes sp. TaxID=1934341 RepID=UPI003D131323